MRVVVECCDASHKRGKVAKLETFEKRLDADGEEMWLPTRGRMTRRTTDATVLSSYTPLMNEDTGQPYLRYRLRCPLCGRTAEVAGRRKLWAALDKLAQNGIEAIDIARIPAILG